MKASFNCEKVTFIRVSLVSSDRFFIVKFHNAKFDFKYNDLNWPDQREGYFLKTIKINELCFLISDRELTHTLRYHQSATKWGSGSDGDERERDRTRQRAAGGKSEPVPWTDAD
ncbi:TPA: hypothetical protein MIU27_03250 [Klebsiella pneumoniae]|nr:hypothetical protein [Klebsiella pneumoniae]